MHLPFLTLAYQVLIDKQTYFGNYHHQKGLCQENNLNMCLQFHHFILLCFNSTFIVNVASFFFKSEFFTLNKNNQEPTDMFK